MDRKRELVDILNKWAYEYYVLDAPTVSDKEYDALYDELRRLEEVVFDGIAWAVDLHIAEARNLFQRFQLDIERQAR